MLSSRDLRSTQLKGVNFINSNRQSLIFADPGAGKTTVVLHGLKLIKPQRTLILATKRICLHVWEQEARLWKGTRNFQFTQLTGKTKKQREELLDLENSGIYLLNYELLQWLVSDYLKSKKRKLHEFFDAVVFDEVSYMKNSGSKRFRACRHQILKVPTRIGMTGTPVGNSLMNIWGQVYVCAGTEPLGSSFNQFKNKFFDSDWNGWVWTPKPGSKSIIYDRIRPYCYKIPVDPYRKSNPINYIPLKYDLPKKVNKEYQHLKEELFLELDTTGGVFEVGGTGAVVKNKLRQIESGAVYVESENKTKPWVNLHSEKIDLLEELVESLQGKPLLLFYEFQHEFKRIKKKFPSAVSIKEHDAVDRWNNNEIDILLAHPKSAGHGLNLHLGGAYNMCFFTLPWSLELWIQCIGRLNRTGQKNQVRVYYFNGPDVETQVFQSLKANRRVEEALISSVRSAA